VPAVAEEIRNELIDELSQVAGIDKQDIVPGATLEELDIDSLDLVELGQIVEERYGVTLERGDFENVTTVGHALDVMVAKIG
jgi:acyl carrier protein